MDDLLQEALDAGLVVMSLFLLRGFGLGPGSDVSRTTPSRGEKLCLWVGTGDMRFGLVPYFALGPITDVSSPASSGGDPFIVWMDDVDGWFDIRGPKVRDVGVPAPSCRMGFLGHLAVFGDNIDAVNGQEPVSTPSSFLALAVFWSTRG